MSITAFDALACFEKLKSAGVPEEQARVQANAFRDFSIIQDESARKGLATKGDIQDTRLEIEKVRLEMKEMETRLSEKIGAGKHQTLQRLIGLLIMQSALLAAVFAFMK